MSRPLISFEARSRQAVRLSNQRTALMHATATRAAQRRAGVAAELDWADLTARAEALRRHTLANLGAYLEQLERAIPARGGQVISARHSAEHCQAIIKLARRPRAAPVSLTRPALPVGIQLTAEPPGWDL